MKRLYTSLLAFNLGLLVITTVMWFISGAPELFDAMLAFAFSAIMFNAARCVSS